MSTQTVPQVRVGWPKKIGQTFLMALTLVLVAFNLGMPYYLLGGSHFGITIIFVSVVSLVLPLFAMGMAPPEKNLRFQHYANLQTAAFVIIGGGIVVGWSVFSLPWIKWVPVVICFVVQFTRTMKPAWKVYKASTDKARLELRITALLGAGGDNMIDAMIFTLLISGAISPLAYVWLLVVTMGIKYVWSRFGIGGGSNKFFAYLCSLINQTAASTVAVWVVLLVARFL